MKTQLQKTGYALLVAAVSAAFMLAAASSSEAAKKKTHHAKAAPAATATTAPLSCLGGGGAVCGTKGGMKFTYANSCYAEHDGAKVSSSKACSGGKKIAKAGKKAKKKK